MDKLKNKKIFVIFCIILIVLFFIILSFKNLFYINKYGKEIKIDNFSKIFKKIPTLTKDLIFNSLYHSVLNNIDKNQSIPKSGALIREKQHNLEFNKEKNLYSGNFVVDINSIKQSYFISFYWSDDENNTYLSGNTVNISCLSKELSIYDFNCKDSQSKYNKILEKNPIINSLPIDVEYYSNNYNSYTKYLITYSENSDNIVINIEDYTGNNYEKALQSIKDRGYNPEDYHINYMDLSSK